MWSRKAVIWAFTGLVALFIGVGYWSNKQSYEAGTLNGINLYHQQCFNVGGYIWNKEGQVVVCKGITTIPHEEMENQRKKEALGT
jgi:hypothetical protein